MRHHLSYPLDFDPYDRLGPQSLGDPVKNTSFDQRWCASDRTLRRTAPFAALLSDLWGRVQHLQVTQMHISTLH
jgi:hypothetical protein